ncbi:MAG: leucine-rich repeat domain-containing protein [Prevotellaceae bacterium]|nr:leucine-rich repeat domain-containing protein [Prevotellaceae bacterium]
MSELICVPAAGPSGKFTVPSTVTRVWGYAFQLNVSITEVTISNNVTVIGDFAFEGCDKLRKIFIPGSVKEIGEGAFRECPALECLEVDEGSEDFCSRDSVLYSKDMSELLRVPAALPFEGGFEMPSSVTTIESHAFYQCVNITKVTIVRNVTVIGKLAFGGCTALKEIASVNPEPPVCEPDAFDDVDKDNCTLVVPEGAKEKYAAADVWKDFPNIVEDPSLGVSAAPATVNEASRYTLDGKQVNAPQKGVNIIRYANGSVKKVIVK